MFIGKDIVDFITKNKLRGIYGLIWKIGLGLVVLWRIHIGVLLFKKKQVHVRL